MEPLDPEYHPSAMPLHDAAYPDSSYRPPDSVQEQLPEEKGGAAPRRQARGPISYPNLPAAAAATASSGREAVAAPLVFTTFALPAGLPAGPVSPLSPTASSPTLPRPGKQPPTLWTPDSIMAIHPNLPPPPPYAPSRPGTGSSAVGPDPPSPTASFSSRAPLHPVMIQLDDGVARPQMSHLAAGRRNESVPTENGGAGGGELGPVALARRRKKKKKRIRIAICCCGIFLLFLVALTVGIAIGVIRANLNRPHSRPPPFPPPRATSSHTPIATTTSAHLSVPTETSFVRG